MMTEADARWALYSLNAEQIDVLCEGVKFMYQDAVEGLYETVINNGTAAGEERYADLETAHNLLVELREIRASFGGEAEKEAPAAEKQSEGREGYAT